MTLRLAAGRGVRLLVSAAQHQLAGAAGAPLRQVLAAEATASPLWRYHSPLLEALRHLSTTAAEQVRVYCALLGGHGPDGGGWRGDCWRLDGRGSH